MIHKCNVVAITSSEEEDPYAGDAELSRIMAANKIDKAVEYELRPACLPYDFMVYWLEAPLNNEKFTAVFLESGVMMLVDTPVSELYDGYMRYETSKL